MVDVAIRKTVDRRPLELVLSAQPLTKPPAGMSFDAPVGFADWTEADVKGRAKPGHCGRVKVDQLAGGKLLALRGRRGSGA